MIQVSHVRSRGGVPSTLRSQPETLTAENGTVVARRSACELVSFFPVSSRLPVPILNTLHGSRPTTAVGRMLAV